MKTVEGITLKGRVKLFKNGELVKEVNNLIVNAGKAEVISLLGSGLGGTAFGYIAIGTSNTAADATQTGLGNEYARQSATVTQTTTNFTNDTAEFEALFTFNANATIEEAGIFNASTGGTMLSRVLTGTQTFQSGDTLRITWDITAQ